MDEMCTEEVKKEKPKEKAIENYAGIIDYNYLDSPFFVNNKKEIKPIKKLLEGDDLGSAARFILDAIQEGGNAVYRKWEKDNKTLEFIITGAFPTLSTFDVWNAIIGIYLKKKAPLFYSKETDEFTVKDSEVTFKISDLVKFMNATDNGQSYKRIKKEVIRLAYCTYTILTEGVYYNKKKDRHIASTDAENIREFEVIKLFGKLKGKLVTSTGEPIVKGDLWSNFSVHRSEQFTITFTPTILDNIRKEYFKYYVPKEYYALPSRGITRRLWLYVLSCKRDKESRTVTRKLSTLINIIPLTEAKLSVVRNNIKSALDAIVNQGGLTDYIMGYDHKEALGISEQNVYFLFGTTKEAYLERAANRSLKNKIKKQIDTKEQYNESLESIYHLDDETYLDTISEDILIPKEELEIYEKASNKWTIVKYYFYTIQETRTNRAGFFKTALAKRWDIRSSSPTLDDYIKSKFDPTRILEEKISKEEAYKNKIFEILNYWAEANMLMVQESFIKRKPLEVKVSSFKRTCESLKKRASFSDEKGKDHLEQLEHHIKEIELVLSDENYKDKFNSKLWIEEMTKVLIETGVIPALEEFEY